MRTCWKQHIQCVLLRIVWFFGFCFSCPYFWVEKKILYFYKNNILFHWHCSNCFKLNMLKIGTKVERNNIYRRKHTHTHTHTSMVIKEKTKNSSTHTTQKRLTIEQIKSFRYQWWIFTLFFFIWVYLYNIFLNIHIVCLAYYLSMLNMKMM